MKIHFDNCDMTSRTGPNSFATRLAQALFESGHQVQTSCVGADVSLVFIERSGATLASNIIQRLDGIWFKPNEFHTKNVGIRDLYGKAAGVIFQSEFDREMVHRWFGAPRAGVVIHNGIRLDPSVHASPILPALAQLRKSYDTVFVCSANWHPQKRLRANIELYDRLRCTNYPNSCLVIMGSSPDVHVVDPHVFYTGSESHDVCMQVYDIADWMIHLAWADHCPNVVIECLSRGTPVICSDVGGTKEIVKRFGVVLRDKPYDNELFDYDHPPTIDVTQLSTLPNVSELGSCHDIDIRHVAEAYVQFMTHIINSK